MYAHFTLALPSLFTITLKTADDSILAQLLLISLSLHVKLPNKEIIPENLVFLAIVSILTAALDFWCTKTFSYFFFNFDCGFPLSNSLSLPLKL